MLSLSSLFILLIAGGLMGWGYFSGLWETVRRLPEAKNPLRLIIGSFALRMALTLGGFYLLADGQWQRMTAALLGFFLIRMVLIRRFGRIQIFS